MEVGRKTPRWRSGVLLNIAVEGHTSGESIVFFVLIFFLFYILNFFDWVPHESCDFYFFSFIKKYKAKRAPIEFEKY